MMIFAKNAKYVAQILAESLVGQKMEEKELSSWVLSLITEKCQAVLNSLTDA